MRLSVPHCPACGGPIDVPPGARRVVCSYCSVKLVVEPDHVSTTHDEDRPATEDADRPNREQPNATLWTHETPHFELSIIEQKIEGSVPELFNGFTLGDDRFAFVALRTVDKEGRPVAHPLDDAFTALRESLENDGDPGLAANMALESLCNETGPRAFANRLECGIVLFEPRHMRVIPYGAGQRNGLVWASSEEGRCIVPTDGHDALERRMLRESRTHFTNGKTLQLAASDLVLIPSAGFLSRGAKRSYADGLRALLGVANESLGEEPLRLVTLAKNAFWKELEQYPDSELIGDIRLAAVRATPPQLAKQLPSGITTRSFRTKRFDVALYERAGEAIQLFPLKEERSVIVWLSSKDGKLPDGAMQIASAPILAVLDGNTGDNENPRRAGREALAALGATESDGIRITVIQLFEQWGRVKYFRRGFKQPLALADRGTDEASMQQFDEGGEASVEEGARLFFAGALAYEGEHMKPSSLAETWRGGKTSRLYQALRAHWKTKKSEPALKQIALAARSDEPTADLSGLALVTGVRAGM